MLQGILVKKAGLNHLLGQGEPAIPCVWIPITGSHTLVPKGNFLPSPTSILYASVFKSFHHEKKQFNITITQNSS
jgi:hypothetical protein